MNLSESEVTLQNSQKRTVTGQSKQSKVRKPKAKLPKTHQDYWANRVRKRTYTAGDGQNVVQIPSWQVRLFYGGRESWFNLEAANLALASIRARDRYIYLRANGWEATLAKFKPQSGLAQQTTLTVGAYLDAVVTTGAVRPRTFINYVHRAN